MIEQFRENIRLAGETYVAAKDGLKSGLKNFKETSRFKRALWISTIGAIIVSSIASKFSVAWYYQGILVVVLVILPFGIWAGKASIKDF